MQIFMNYCIKSKVGGSIVNIASHYGIISPDPRIYNIVQEETKVYGAKRGIIQMTKYFSVNAIWCKYTLMLLLQVVLKSSKSSGWKISEEDGKRCPMVD